LRFVKRCHKACQLSDDVVLLVDCCFHSDHRLVLLVNHPVLIVDNTVLIVKRPGLIVNQSVLVVNYLILVVNYGSHLGQLCILVVDCRLHI
jgi:hypothetical protein